MSLKIEQLKQPGGVISKEQRRTREGVELQNMEEQAGDLESIEEQAEELKYGRAG